VANQKIFFTVIIPTLNEEKFLPHLLGSLAAQTYKDFEVIVVDGKSKDQTVPKASSYAKTLPSLRIVQSDRASLPLQRNKGAAAARGEWLIFIDADVVVLPYFLDRAAWFIQTSRPEFFTTWFCPDSDLSGDATFTLLGNIFVESSIRLHRPISPGPMTIISNEVFRRVGGYDESLKFGEDYDITKRVVKLKIPLKLLRETLYVFSLRRVRNEGKLKFLTAYTTASLITLLTKHAPKQIHGYHMGGHLYSKNTSFTKNKRMIQMKKKFETVMNELFG
jgi:glycosyltransferase involved in cell wall biosynthesis